MKIIFDFLKYFYLTVDTSILLKYKDLSKIDTVKGKVSFFGLLFFFLMQRKLGFFITSYYRTVSYNKKIGGKSNSKHLKGLAIDIPLTFNKLKGIKEFADKYNVKISIVREINHYHIEIEDFIPMLYPFYYFIIGVLLLFFF